MCAICDITLRQQIAIGQQHRKRSLVRAQRDGKFCEHIRAIREVGDATKAFGFALRTKGTVGDIEPLEREVGTWIKARRYRQHAALGQRRDSH